MRKKEVLGLVLGMLSVLMASYFFPQMPELMSIDFLGVKGISRVVAVFVFPAACFLVWAFYKTLDRTDPFVANFESYRVEAESFLNVLLVLVLYFQFMVIRWNTGTLYYDSQVLLPFFSTLIFSAGILVGRAERGGIHAFITPWTLKSPEVRRRTHEKAGFFLKLVAVLGMTGVFFPHLSGYFITVPLVLAILWLTVYSYMEYMEKSV